MAEAATDIDHALDMLIPPSEGAEARLFDAMRYAAMGGGKRLRGFLVLEGARQFGVGRDTALRTAAAIEMLHAYSLVHDDLPCMDDDDLRRGKPTVHKAFDEATAVLAGDALQAHAFHVLAETDTHADPAVRIELCRSLARAAGPRGMCGGQMMDMLAERGRRADGGGRDRPPADAEDRQADRIRRRGRRHPRQGAARRCATRLAAYGRDLGAAFQIADDLLDATASAEEAGKRTGKDAGAGKATLVGLLGVRARPCAGASGWPPRRRRIWTFWVIGPICCGCSPHYAIARRN